MAKVNYGGGRNQGKSAFTEQQKAERALISVLKDWPLEPGQMLLVGPKSAKILMTPNAFAGSLPDTLVIEKVEWSVF